MHFTQLFTASVKVFPRVGWKSQVVNLKAELESRDIRKSLMNDRPEKKYIWEYRDSDDKDRFERTHTIQIYVYLNQDM